MDTFWQAFLPQLLATLVGGLVSVAAAFLSVNRAFKLERSAQYEDRVTTAASELLAQLGIYGERIEANTFLSVFHRARARLPELPTPSRNAVSVAIERLVIVTQGHERDFAKSLGNAWDVIAQGQGMTANAVGLLAGAVREWRTGEAGSDLERIVATAQKLATVEPEPESGLDEQIPTGEV